jgi:hypothetical protein
MVDTVLCSPLRMLYRAVKVVGDRKPTPSSY